MTLVYGDTLSFYVGFKDKKMNKKIDFASMKGDPYIWLVINNQEKERKLWKEQKSQGFEFRFEEISDLYPGEYDCEVGIRYGNDGYYRYQTKNKFTLTVVEGERVPVSEEREAW